MHKAFARIQTVSEPQNFQTRSVLKIHINDLSQAEFYHRFRKPSLPVVLQGALEGIPAWSLDFMRRTIGEHEFTIRYYGKGHFDVPKNQWTKYSDFRKMTFNDYADLIESGKALKERAYLAQMPIGDSTLLDGMRPTLSRFANRYKFNSWIQGADWNIWVGPSGHTEPLHFDNADGTLLQLHGSKTVDLFPAKCLTDLYPFNFYDVLPPWVSKVNIETIDFEAFPAMKRAIQYWHQITLEEGELLFIPIGWWHEVTGVSSDYVCSLNRFWKPEPFMNNFCNRRVGTFFFVNKLPWEFVLKLDAKISGLLKRGK